MFFNNRKVDDMFEGTGLKPAGEKRAAEVISEDVTYSGTSLKLYKIALILCILIMVVLWASLLHEMQRNEIVLGKLAERNNEIGQLTKKNETLSKENETLSVLVLAQQSKINATYHGIDVMPNDDPGPGPEEFENSDQTETPESSNNLTPEDYEKRMKELGEINRDENPGIDEPTPITESLVSNDSPGESWSGPSN